MARALTLSRGGLGRIARPDARDQRYHVGNLLPVKAAPLKDKAYTYGPILDQGSTPRCVGFSVAGIISGGPIMQLTDVQAQLAAGVVYNRAQAEFDEWPGEDYDGTSVRAGFKAAVAMGYFASYVWSWDLATSTRYFREVGPGVDGIDWYTGLFSPKRQKDGSYYVEPTGAIEGGHAIRRVRYSVKRKATLWANSWGVDGWGLSPNGTAWIHDDALGDLLRWGGEFCAGVEVRLPQPKTLGKAA